MSKISAIMYAQIKNKRKNKNNLKDKNKKTKK